MVRRVIRNRYHFPVFRLPYDWRLEKIHPSRRHSRQQEQRGRFVHSRKGRSQRQHPIRKTARTFNRSKPYSFRIAG